MGYGVGVGRGEVCSLGEAVSEGELDSHLGEGLHQARRHVGRSGDDQPQAASQELGAVHLAEAGENVADTGDYYQDSGLDPGQLADGGLHIFAGIDEIAGVEAAHSARDQAEYVAQGQQADVAVHSDDLAGLEDGIVAAAHQGTVRKDGSLGSAGGAAGEEDGGRLLFIDICDRCLGLADRRGGEHLHPLQVGAERRKLVAHEDGGDVEFPAGTCHCGSGQGCGEIHRHISGGSHRQEELDGIQAVAVENSYVRAFWKACRLDKGAAAGDALCKFFICIGFVFVADCGAVGISLGHPLHELAHRREIRQFCELLCGDHIIKIVRHLV